jgi:hypothetical protein
VGTLSANEIDIRNLHDHSGDALINLSFSLLGSDEVDFHEIVSTSYANYHSWGTLHRQ